MLKIHFINVGDGDSILLEEFSGGSVRRVLIDTGRHVPKNYPGSLYQTAAEYLKKQGITHIETLIITHLHLDHFQGLSDILGGVTFDTLLSGYLPPEDAASVPEEPESLRTVRGMITALNGWYDCVTALKCAGTVLREINEAYTFTLPGGTSLTVYPPKENWFSLQHRVWHCMYRGLPCGDDEKYRASKSRNPSSLRVFLSSAGRTVVLGGDCYGEEWDSEPLEPCDILKIPHHCDAKSVTPLLAQKLRPTYAVVCCGAEYMPDKDRPSETAAGYFTALGAKLYMTDCFSAPWYTPRWWNACIFEILDDGTIVPPDTEK